MVEKDSITVLSIQVLSSAHMTACRQVSVLGWGGGGGGGGVERRDAYSRICYGVCCCCAAAGWLGLAGWAGPPCCPPWLLGLALGEPWLLPAKWWIAGHSTLQPPTLTGTKNILKSKIFKLIYRQ